MMTLATLLSLAGLATEPVEGDRPGEVLPTRDWDVLHLHLDLRIDPSARSVRGTATHTMVPLGRPSPSVELHQVGLEITGVQVDGREVEGWRLGRETVRVPVPPGTGERVVAVAWRATPELGLHFREPGASADRAVQVWSHGQAIDNRHWFPSWDHVADRFEYSADITVSTGLHAITNGVFTGRRSEEPGWTTWSYSLDERLVGYLVAVSVGDYEVVHDDGDVPIEHLVPAGTGRVATLRSLGIAREQLEWMSTRLDTPFPYPVYRQVVVQRFLYSGMENTTLTLVGDHRMIPDSPVPTTRTEALVAHELAHQWFGDLLSCYGWRELWLNEGLASYWATRWLEHAHGPELAAVIYRRKLDEALEPEAPMAPRGWSRVPDRAGAAVYARGAWVMRMLESHLGRDVLERGLAGYLAEHRDRAVETDDLRRSLEDASGEHLGWLFDRWVHGAVMPGVRTSSRWEDGALVVELDQPGGTCPGRVAVEVGTAREVLRRQVWLDGELTRLVVELERPPRWVAVDPDGGFLARWEHHQEAEQWVAQLRDSPSPWARVVAMDQLAGVAATRSVIDALEQVLDGTEAHPAYRAYAAEPLGVLGSDRAVVALLEAADDPAPEVRIAVAEALWQVPGSEEVRATLVGLVVEDPSPPVRAAALRSLAIVEPGRALPLARRALRRPDHHPVQVVHAAALEVLQEEGGARDLGAILGLAAPDQPRGARHAAGQAAVGLARRLGLDQSDRARVARVLEGWLDDLDARTRVLGAELLGEVGDESSERRLRAVAQGTGVERLREVALDSASSIRERRSGG